MTILRYYSILFVLLASFTSLTTAAFPADKADSGLAFKVEEYEAKQKRLHTIAEELSKLSGVDIKSGAIASDWQVRDIPVTIAVKNIKLGDLLELIAESTHTRIRATEVDNGKRTIYRFIRDKKTQDQLANNEQEIENRRQADWSHIWDSIVKLGSFDSKFEINTDLISQDNENENQYRENQMKELQALKPLGKLMGMLGPEAKAGVLAGDTVMISGDNRERLALLNEYRRLKDGLPSDSGNIPNNETPELVIGLRKTSTNGTDMVAFISYVKEIEEPSDDISNIVEKRYTENLDNAVAFIGLAKDFTPSPVFLASDNNYRQRVSGNPKDLNDAQRKFLVSKEDWQLPELQTKIKLDLPKDRNKLTYADYLSLLSEASGYSIICEDFMSHRCRSYTNLDQLPGKDATLGEYLRAVSQISFNEYERSSGLIYQGWWWSIDTKSKTIMGWALNWCSLQTYLVPENLYTYTQAKLNSTGLELSDVVKLMNLAPKQFYYWFKVTEDGKTLERAFNCSTKLFWQVYDYLPSEQKKLALSEDGISLGLIDPGWLKQIIREQSRELSTKDPDDLPDKDGVALQSNTFVTDLYLSRLLGNYGLLQSSKMIIKSKEANYSLSTRKIDGYDSLIKEPLPKGLKRSQYDMIISGGSDDNKFKLNLHGPMLSFPVYSIEREKELRKKN